MLAVMGTKKTKRVSFVTDEETNNKIEAYVGGERDKSEVMRELTEAALALREFFGSLHELDEIRPYIREAAAKYSDRKASEMRKRADELKRLGVETRKEN